jgi:hypothetical protein
VITIVLENLARFIVPGPGSPGPEIAKRVSFVLEVIVPANTPVTWGEAITHVLGFLVILLVGWLIARLLYSIVVGLLHRLNFNRLAERSGFSRFVEETGLTTDPSHVIGSLVYWFVLLLTLIVAFDSLGLPAVSAVLNDVLLWLPHLLVALVILMLAGLVANFVFGVVRGSAMEAGSANPDLLASLARAAVWVFAVLIALDELGIATTIVTSVVFGMVFAVALALGLAFGLGGRDVAAQIVQSWYRPDHRIQSPSSEPPPTGPGRGIPYRGGPEEPRRAA